MPDKIQVTKTYLPDKQEFLGYVDKIWNNGWLTNNGSLSIELEDRLKSFLGVPNIKFVSSGTTALQLAINAFGLEGEVITTPYSYIATTSAILWQNCNPVFCDIGENSFNIDPEQIEAKITSRTSAIIATHVYGLPCEVEKIEKIAMKYNLKVIYDAAHCFAVEVDGNSIFNFGDASVTSFHATKIFQTVEGGAVISNSKKVDEIISLNRAFGHIGDKHYRLGINGKNSEFHAAMGLCNLKNIGSRIEKRKRLFHHYIKGMENISVCTLQIPNHIKYNYAYFPIIFSSEKEMLKVKKGLETDSIFPRRYFYPSINTIDYLEGNSCPRSEEMAKKVLCLPLYEDLSIASIDKIARIIKRLLDG